MLTTELAMLFTGKSLGGISPGMSIDEVISVRGLPAPDIEKYVGIAGEQFRYYGPLTVATVDGIVDTITVGLSGQDETDGRWDCCNPYDPSLLGSIGTHPVNIHDFTTFLIENDVEYKRFTRNGIPEIWIGGAVSTGFFVSGPNAGKLYVLRLYDEKNRKLFSEGLKPYVGVG